MRLFVVLVLVIHSYVSQAQRYPAATIPEEMKEGVDWVMREDYMRWNISAPNRATCSVRYVAAILNPKGDGAADVTIFYDKLEKISDLKITVYDAAGFPVRKVKNSEIQDRSMFDGVSLFNDNRLKTVDVAQSTYPYTVEVEYQKEYTYLFHNLSSAMLSGPRMSCENFLFEITYRSNLPPRHRVLNHDVKPKHSINDDNTETLTWEAHNLKAIKPEPLGPSFDEIHPRVVAVPLFFEFSGYSGSMKSWDDYNKWILSLNKGRDVLPEAAKQKVNELTSNLNSTAEKSKALYEYMQSKTRYVGIQLGIGGFQPFEASVVDEVGYGDCKALSNYMVALLKEAGITGYYTLIRAGEDEREMMVDFPSSQFNHAIVAVPDGKDTLWLECTSQTNPFGYQGNFTGKRKALLITQEGGKVVNTKNYPGDLNVRDRRASVELLATGDAKARVTTLYKGLRYESAGLDYYISRSQEDQKKWLLETTRIPNFNIDQFKLVNNKAINPSANVEVGLTLNRFASVSGKRLFLTPNLMSRSTYIPETVASRKSNVILKEGFVDRDSIVYTIPEAIYPEFVPPVIKHESRFGTYEANFALDQGRLIYTRKFTMKEGVYPPESYQEYVDFYKNINKADNLKIVFLSKT